MVFFGEVENTVLVAAESVSRHYGHISSRKSQHNTDILVPFSKSTD